MKVLALIVGLLLICGIAQAGLLENVPDLKQSVGYELSNNDGGNIVSLTTVDVVGYKDIVSLGAGVMTELDNDDNINPVATINYKVGGLEDLGITYPLAKYVNLEVGAYAGRDLDEPHYRYGIQATIIKIKL